VARSARRRTSPSTSPGFGRRARFRSRRVRGSARPRRRAPSARAGGRRRRGQVRSWTRLAAERGVELRSAWSASSPPLSGGPRRDRQPPGHDLRPGLAIGGSINAGCRPHRGQRRAGGGTGQPLEDPWPFAGRRAAAAGPGKVPLSKIFLSHSDRAGGRWRGVSRGRPARDPRSALGAACSARTGCGRMKMFLAAFGERGREGESRCSELGCLRGRRAASDT